MDDEVLTPKELVALIEKFLAERTESEDSGYAKVTYEDMKHLSNIVYKVIEAKWGRDADGDLPVNYDLIDRTRYQRLWWTKVPYHHKDAVGHVKAVIDNLAYASEMSRRIQDVIHYFNKEVRSMVEYVANQDDEHDLKYEAEKFLYTWFRGENND